LASPEQSAATLVFAARRECRMPRTTRNPDPQTTDKRYLQTTIGDLRKLYGPDFAKGYADNEKIVDVIRKQPSLMTVILHYETRWFEKL
jgi:hypothetical protein